MSKHVVSLVYSRKAGSLLRKAVLAYVADVANHDGTGVWSSKQRIADEIEASRRGVVNAVASLVEDGILIEAGKRPCANGYTVEYSIDLDVVAALPVMPHDKGDPCINAHVNPVHATPAPGAHDTCTPFTQTVLNRPKPTSKDVKSEIPENPKRKAAPKGAARGSRISENWAPTPKDYAFASSHNLTTEEINHEADKFRNYWLAATKNAAKRDWEATWRNWLTGDFGIVTKKRERAASKASGTYTAGQSSGGGLVAAGMRAVSESRGYGESFSEGGRLGSDYVIEG
jgi:biotin operon repressor